MKRVRNATDFLGHFRGARLNYERSGRLIAELRNQVDSTSLPTALPRDGEARIEAHVRAYFIDPLLQALNWQVGASSGEGLIVPEVPIRSAQSGTTRFLDYAGIERNGGEPLLIAEAKHPKSSLPDRGLSTAEYDRSTQIARGLQGLLSLGAEWKGYLSTLSDYVRSVTKRPDLAPRRVFITNGDWLILFLDPADAFLPGGKREPGKILVYEDRDDVEQHFGKLFQHLEYGAVRGEASAVEMNVGELRFYVEPGAVACVMHGLRLVYIEQRTIYGFSESVIHVAPVLFLRTGYGNWFRIEGRVSDRIYTLASSYEKLLERLDEVRIAAEALLQEVNAVLGTVLTPTSLVDHYADEEAFATLPGVTECENHLHERSTEYLIVTGARTHYLLPAPTVTHCPHRDWEKSHALGVAADLIRIRKWSGYNPKSFFLSGQPHHCAHRWVADAKASQIRTVNQERCGCRSGKEGEAFCEIARFETPLCCRTCAFEEVCTKAAVFRLPCQR